MKLSRPLAALVVCLVAFASIAATAHAGGKPSHLTAVILGDANENSVPGYVGSAARACQGRRTVVLYGERGDGEGSARKIATTRTNAQGDYEFNRELNTRLIYQVVAPAAKREGFTCRAGSSGLLAFA